MAMIPMNKAKVCLNCDVLFDEEDRCPTCASKHWHWLSQWL